MSLSNHLETIQSAHALLKQHRYDDAHILLSQMSLSPDLSDHQKADIGLALKDVVMVRTLRNDAAKATGWPSFDCDWHVVMAHQAKSLALGLTAVLFHVDSEEAHPYLKQKKHVDYRSMLAAACQSALRNGIANVVVLTNAKSDMSHMPTGVVVVRLPADPSRMMFDRARVYRAMMRSAILPGPALFLDTDVLLNRDMAPLFDLEFDVALTYRPEIGLWHMPINEAMMLAKPTPGAVAFFDAYIGRYAWLAAHQATLDRYGFNVQRWRGGQLALALLTDWTVPKADIARKSFGQTSCVFLPCDDFNYAARNGDDFGALQSKWAVHFKGAAKSAALQYLAAQGTALV